MSALSSVAALPLIASSPAVAGGDRAFDSDREILDVVAKIFELMPRYTAASEASNAIEAYYEDNRPETPDALLWRIGDPVSYSYDVTRDGCRYLVCDFHQIEERKAKPRLKWKFLGTDEEYEATSSEDFDDLGNPLPGVADQWQGSIDPIAAKRHAELVAALDQYQSACHAARRNLNAEVLLEEFERLSGEMDELVERLIGLRAYSIEALRAKAAVYAHHLHPDFEEDTVIEESGFELVRSLISDLGGQFSFAAPRAAEGLTTA